VLPSGSWAAVCLTRHDVDERRETGDDDAMSDHPPDAKADAKAADPKQKDEPFEKTLEKLEKTLEKLEKSDLPLEDALTAYEEGLRLVKSAQGKLDRMDARLEQLLANGQTAPLKDGTSDPSKPR
jgi:exodeoxyribonuclease VII small subunit